MPASFSVCTLNETITEAHHAGTNAFIRQGRFDDGIGAVLNRFFLQI